MVIDSRGRDFYLEFDDTECTVDAYFEDWFVCRSPVIILFLDKCIYPYYFNIGSCTTKRFGRLREGHKITWRSGKASFLWLKTVISWVLDRRLLHCYTFYEIDAAAATFGFIPNASVERHWSFFFHTIIKGHFIKTNEHLIKILDDPIKPLKHPFKTHLVQIETPCD